MLKIFNQLSAISSEYYTKQSDVEFPVMLEL